MTLERRLNQLVVIHLALVVLVMATGIGWGGYLLNVNCRRC